MRLAIAFVSLSALVSAQPSQAQAPPDIADLVGATAGLLLGGVIAAPFGAFAAKHFSPKLLLILVGVVLPATSLYGVWTAFA